MPAKRKPIEGKHVCPFCEDEIFEASFPFCQTCKVTVLVCSECQKPISRDKDVCPHCGAKVRPQRSKKGES